MDERFSHLAVEFFADTVQDKRKSAEEGRPIYDDVEKIRIRIAGDPKTEFVGLAHDQSSERDPNTNQRLTYAQLHHGPYEAFKAGQQYTGSGTPLTELPFLPASRVKELQAASVFTAEALAEMDGTNLQRLGMGARELKDQAAAYLEKAAGAADVTKYAAENAALHDRIAQLEALMKKDAEPVIPASDSPFADWDEETISLWIVEQGGEKPHHKTGKPKLIQLADELNAELEKKAA